MNSVELSDTIIESLAKLVDDGQAEFKGEPTHATLTFHMTQANLLAGDPTHAGQIAGKAKRITPRVERRSIRPLEHAELNRRNASGFNATWRLI